MTMRSCCIVWMLALLAAATATAQTPEPAAPEAVLPAAELARRIDAYVRPFEAAGLISGSLLVARDSVVVYERSFGMANYELGVPSTPATRFCVASISKPMTQIVAIRLMEQKKLALGDPLAKWFPDFPRAQDITVEHLFRHRAGIPHRVTSDADEIVAHSAADMVEFAKKKEILFEPGSQSLYSSAGYSVLARVLELAAGRSFEELLEEFVFAPAGAVQSVHPGARRLIPNRAQGYAWGPHGPVQAPLRDYSYLVGAGSIFSTPRDLLAIQQALVSGAYGESARRSLVDENGLDWNGITDAYRAFADYHAGSKLAVIFTANRFTGAADLLRRDIPKIAAGETVPPPQVPKVEPVAVPPASRARFEGTYEVNGSPEDLRFDGADGTLASLGNWPLVAVSEDTFYSPQDFGKVKVVTGKDGEVEGLDWESPTYRVQFPRHRGVFR
ncbi:MAG TPA: serine hydrolase domain-containing protein [Thermoanaerobaculia bacterium]|nr:serine hydrolase domain-containing protein [Thermoanaerobaculia bacterium]